MREIDKGRQPPEMTAYLAKTPTASFDDLKTHCGEEIRVALNGEQKGLCAFCCNRLTGYDPPHRIAHIVPQVVDPTLSTRYENWVLSCNAEQLANPSCDVAQKDRPLPVDPLTPSVEKLFRFFLSGRVEGITAAAEKTIEILNLDTRSEGREHRLRRARRVAIEEAIKLRPHIPNATWHRMLAGSFQPMPAFQPAIAYLVK